MSGPDPSEGAGRRADRTTSGRSGRRAQVSRGAGALRSRLDVLVVLAVVLPLVVLASVAVIGEEQDHVPSAAAPEGAPLADATVICPASVSPGEGADVVAMRVPEVDGGEVTVRTGSARLRRPRTVDVPGPEPVALPRTDGLVALDATGDAASGLVAGRREALVSEPCRAPAYDEWFLGLGGSARNGSTLTLVNPDDSAAVVDVNLIGPRGPIDEDAGRGITIEGGRSVRVDLASVAPRRADVAAHLSVSRGRVSMTVEHRYDPLGSGEATVDTLPAQSRAASRNLLLGVAPAGSQRSLYLANPGDDEVRATVRVMNADAVFTPSDTEDVVVPPRTQVRVPLAGIVDAQAAEGMLGLVVEASGPVLSTVRGLDRGDLVAVGAAEVLRAPAAVVVPQGKARLVVGGARRAGVVRVRAYDAAGKVLLKNGRVEIGADRGASLALPAGTAGITVEASATPVAAAVVVDSDGGTPGSAVVPVRPADVTADVPVVRPR
ncbi:DUF5719 family protein [Nocardioides sp. YIM 152588]|uniref:DUF5719 family protein n=1 Tax=Nocardioides sp. YIM 152588 TaxID=3158259 RepID=UPI0032E5257E